MVGLVGLVEGLGGWGKEGGGGFETSRRVVGVIIIIYLSITFVCYRERVGMGGQRQRVVAACCGVWGEGIEERAMGVGM